MRRRSLLLFVFVPLIAVACGGDNDSPTAPTPNVPFSATDLRVGTGTEATNGRSVNVAYSLWLYSATAPDNKGQAVESNTYNFVLGRREVIAGWDQGIPGMRVGGQRRLIIPPDLAYGSQGRAPIPPNTTLVFDVDLLNVQ
jgi:FKBP-type peptidyl-prolyl cis-trans isomerase FkpA